MKIKMGKKDGKGIVGILVAVVMMTTTIVPIAAGASPRAGEAEQRSGIHGKRRHPPALGIWRDRQAIEKLKLTDGQVQQLRDADYTAREKRLELKTQIDRMRLQMDKAFTRETRDEKAVRQLAQTMAGVQGQLFVQHVEARLVLEAILTPEQVRNLGRDALHRKKGGRGMGKQHGGGGHLAGGFEDADYRHAQ